MDVSLDRLTIEIQCEQIQYMLMSESKLEFPVWELDSYVGVDPPKNNLKNQDGKMEIAK